MNWWINETNGVNAIEFDTINIDLNIKQLQILFILWLWIVINFLFQLEPGDRILAVNGEDVKDAPRDHVIQLVRSCDTQVNLLVCQPAMSICAGRKSTLLSAGKRAKLRSRPSRVRFAESVCVNGAPLFPVSIITNINV